VHDQEQFQVKGQVPDPEQVQEHMQVLLHDLE
jgi:hypothetical protein